tara:strand:- start:2098 stop:2556 length:459 start_codon:yes stop_codon:yes gene_type:complete
MVTKKSEATDNSADVLGVILEKLGAMEAKIGAIENSVEEASQPPPLTVTKDNPYENKSVITDTIYPNAPNLFKKGDIVKVSEETELAKLIMKRGSADVVNKIKGSGQGILGSITEYTTTNPRTGEPRFEVHIPGVGEEQVYYKDLELVSSTR